MRAWWMVTALTFGGLLQAGSAAAQANPATLGSTLVGVPRFSTDGANTRVVLDLTDRAVYALEVTPEGLRLRSVSLNFQASGRISLGHNGIQYAATASEATLFTPHRLTEQGGWRASEATLSSGRRVLIVDLGATLHGGARSLPLPGLAKAVPASPAASVPTPVLPASAIPASPAPTPATAVVEDGRQASVVQGGGQLSDLKPTSVQDTLPVPLLPTPAPAFHSHSGLRGVTAGSLKGGMVSAPRVGKNPGVTRVVLDLPAGVAYQIVPGREGLVINLTGVQAVNAQALSVSAELLGWHLRPTTGGAILTLKTAKPTAENSGWHGLLLSPNAESPSSRLVLDISPAHANTTPLNPADRRLALVPRLSRNTGFATLSLPATTMKPRVVLDAGHGGKDPGAVGAVVEKEVTLNVAKQVRDLLVAAGVEVVMTREDDRELHPLKNQDLLMRSEMARGSQLFVSIHANATPPTNAVRGYGVETWWNPNHAGSRLLAQAVQSETVGVTGAFDRGTKDSQPLGVLRQNPVPAALVEIGFTSHPVDGLNLKDQNYLERVSLGIARGIHRTLLGR